MTLTYRIATEDDLPRLAPMIEASIDELQRGFLDEAQIRASHQIMGVAHQLIEDKTYYVVEDAGRNSRMLDPRAEPARIRAMYTDPSFTSLSLMATLAGLPLYEAAGFVRVEDVVDSTGGVPIPLVRMARDI